tara:strand:- start:769 stop:1215 length:447 start_codon:yes stop_codon:yes gene_type:complete
MLTKKHFKTIAESIALPLEFTIGMFARTYEGDYPKSVIEYGPLHDLRYAITSTSLAYSRLVRMSIADNPRFEIATFNDHIKSEAANIAGYACNEVLTTVVRRIISEAVYFTFEDMYGWMAIDLEKVMEILVEVKGVEIDPFIIEYNLV